MIVFIGRYGDLKSSVKNISSVNENTSKDELIQTLMNQVSDLQGQADLRESQVFLVRTSSIFNKNCKKN